MGLHLTSKRSGFIKFLKIEFLEVASTKKAPVTRSLYVKAIAQSIRKDASSCLKAHSY